jgi:hypothetical protein
MQTESSYVPVLGHNFVAIFGQAYFFINQHMYCNTYLANKTRLIRKNILFSSTELNICVMRIYLIAQMSENLNLAVKGTGNSAAVEITNK